MPILEPLTKNEIQRVNPEISALASRKMDRSSMQVRLGMALNYRHQIPHQTVRLLA